MAKRRNDLGSLLADLTSGPSYSDFEMPAIRPRPFGEAEAELFMEGLKSQVQQIEASLKPDQQLVMICWHGHEKLQVLSVGMPSNNVVALHCRDSEGNTIQVTGHMNSITFSFQVLTAAKAPAKQIKIGFDMPKSKK